MTAKRNGLRLYLLERKTDDCGYDEASGFVVAAVTPEEARELAAGQAGDEGRTGRQADAWSTCRLLAADYRLGKTARVILRDFRAG